MRLFYTLLTVIAVCAASHAQIVIGQESAPTIGDSWATYNLILPSADFPVPVVGTETAYDFSAIGDFEDEDFALLVKNIPLDSIARLDILAIPAETDDPAFDSLPGTAVLSSYIFPELDEDGNEFALNNILDVNDQGVFTLAEAELNFFTGEVDLVRLEEPEQVFSFTEQFGDTTMTSSSVVEEDTDFGTQDSTYTTETRIYAGYGSLETWFGSYDEVAVYRTVSELQFFSRPLGSTEPYGTASIQVTVTYDFVRPGSFAPVVSYFYDTFDRDNLTVSENINFTYSVPLNLTDVTSVDEDRFRLSVSPNPANERVTVAFDHPVSGPANLRLFNVAGREVLNRDLGELPAGNHQLPLEFSTKLPTGTYFLRISDGVATSTAPLIIK